MELYRTDLFIPRYQPFEGERWQMRIAPLLLCRGYWSEARLVENMAALIRRDGDDWRTWMSMTPMEMESQEIGCRLAEGHTVVMGLGMGWAAVNTALNPAVSRVTVIEYDPEVIEAVRQSDPFSQLPDEAAAKITVIQGDAYTWTPAAGDVVDTLLTDIWLPLYGPDRLREVAGMVANTGARRVYCWGQEMNIAHHLREKGLPLDTAGIALAVADSGLPLLGPDLPDYLDKTRRAVAAWGHLPA